MSRLAAMWSCGSWLQRALAVAVCFALLVLAVLPYVVSQAVVTVCSLALVFAVLAISVNVLAGLGGMVTLGQAGIFASGAYGAAYMAVRAEQPFWVQVITGLLVSLVCAAVFGVLAMRTSGVYFLMVTLAQGMIVWGLAIRLSTLTGAESGLSGIRRPEAVSDYWAYYYVCLAGMLVALGVYAVLARSPFGLGIRALSESERRVRMLGYNPPAYKFYAFMISGTLAGMAGVLYVYLNGFVSAASADFPVSGQAVLMVIIGGVGTLIGPVIGAFAIVFGQNYISFYTERWNLILGMIYILVILFARQGVVGLVGGRFGRPATSAPTVHDMTGAALPQRDVSGASAVRQ